MEMQNQIKQAVVDYIKEHGYAPTVREIGAVVGLSSSASVHRYLTAAIDAGLLETDALVGTPRAIRVPGMRWINTQDYASVVRQLASLREHCQAMAAEPESAEDWRRDVEALDRVMATLSDCRKK